MLQANPTLTFRYPFEEKKNVVKAYFCVFHLRMRSPRYATKRLFASFAMLFFEKFAGAPHGQKHKYGMGDPHRVS